MKRLIILPLVLLAAAVAASVPGFVYWPQSGWAAWNTKLAAEMKDAKALGKDLDKFGNHWSMIARRTADGEAEVHENVTDVFIAQRGEAVLKVGGVIKGQRIESAGEFRGAGIEGGTQVTLRPGDIVHIPAGMPHQLLLKREFLYFVTKVQEKGPEDAKGFGYWSKSDLAAYSVKLKAKLDGKNVATERLADWGSHLLMLVYRTGDGEAEVHEKQVDYFWIQSGTTTVAVGGRTLSPRSTGPGEIRGASVDGGDRVVMKPGDVAHIPANVPHQALSRGELLYAVLKVTQ